MFDAPDHEELRTHLNSVLERVNTSYDTSNANHQQLLRTRNITALYSHLVWTQLRPNELPMNENTLHRDDRWKSLGFQGSNPVR
jgi:hypothetical protein